MAALNKRLYKVSALIILILFSVFFLSIKNVKKENSKKETAPLQAGVGNTIKTTINYGDNIIELVIPYQDGVTVYDALESSAKSGGLTLDTKKYDFGIMVNRINNVGGETNKAWMFYVNGKTADKGSDSTFLSPGDMVEWKYQSL